MVSQYHAHVCLRKTKYNKIDGEQKVVVKIKKGRSLSEGLSEKQWNQKCESAHEWQHPVKKTYMKSIP